MILPPVPDLPYEDSRRLPGVNLYFSQPCAVLETQPDPHIDDALVALWRERVEFALAILNWPPSLTAVRRTLGGNAFAVTAPPDQLFVATEVNEWAFLYAYFGSDAAKFGSAIEGSIEGPIDGMFHAPAFPPIWNDDIALHTLRLAAAAERHADLLVLIGQAHQHHLPVLMDDEEVTVGEGAGARTWRIDALPSVESLPWRSMHAIPVALVTGSNGKTTTTRLVAAMCEAHGWRTAFSCTDGVFVGGEAVASGDYSGPAGARTALRHPQAQAAVLETARGGILRRGLAVDRAQVGIVTNISADHFGEYGVRELDELAHAKLVVARALEPGGLLILNADDEALVRLADGTSAHIAWFALDADHPFLCAQRASAGMTCGVRSGELLLHRDGTDHSLGMIANMPLTMHGTAVFNIANIAGACLVASAMQIPIEMIAQTLARFGGEHGDNPGRLMRWSFGSSTAIVDYAHNPEGLHGLLAVARAAASGGRLVLVLGQAGNREDADIRKLAATAAAFSPGFVVLKDIESYLRGRARGEIPAILEDELLRHGIAQTSIVTVDDEMAATRAALAGAQNGDAIVLPIHDRAARLEIVAFLDKLEARNWSPGSPLPAG